MNDLIVASTSIVRHPIITIQVARHYARIRKLLKQEGYKAPLTQDIWTVNVYAGFYIIMLADGSRRTYNTRTLEFLD